MKKEGITQKDFNRIKKQMIRYIHSFRAEDPDLKINVAFKKDHTFRVTKEAVRIAKKLKLKKEDILAVKLITLLHDIGRFEQYRKYRTFVDLKSVNHAQLSVRLIQKFKFLSGFDPGMKRTILAAIGIHNCAVLPRSLTPKQLFFTRILRDADKLDNFHIDSLYYNRQYQADNHAIALGLPDKEGFSPGVYQNLLKGKPVLVKQLKTLNDYKLMQIAWIYDINFPPAFRRIRKKHYLEKICRVLPQTAETKRIYKTVEQFISRKIKEAV